MTTRPTSRPRPGYGEKRNRRRQLAGGIADNRGMETTQGSCSFTRSLRSWQWCKARLRDQRVLRSLGRDRGRVRRDPLKKGSVIANSTAPRPFQGNEASVPVARPAPPSWGSSAGRNNARIATVANVSAKQRLREPRSTMSTEALRAIHDGGDACHEVARQWLFRFGSPRPQAA
jgi:hypothetical protein